MPLKRQRLHYDPDCSGKPCPSFHRDEDIRVYRHDIQQTVVPDDILPLSLVVRSCQQRHVIGIHALHWAESHAMLQRLYMEHCPIERFKRCWRQWLPADQMLRTCMLGAGSVTACCSGVCLEPVLALPMLELLRRRSMLLCRRTLPGSAQGQDSVRGSDWMLEPRALYE